MARSSVAIVLGLILGAQTAYAKKTVEPVYQDPFDLAAGGASLTRASKEGTLFSNPALLNLASGFVRWIGSSTTLTLNKESVNTARKFLPKSACGRGGASSTNSSSTNSSTEIVDDVLKNPVRLGWGEAISLLTRRVGGAFFSRFELDLGAHEYGPAGLPQIELQTESYNGFALGAPVPTSFSWLIFGVTAKYLMASEEYINADLVDQTQVTKYSDPKMAKSLYAQNSGVGLDAAALLFFQGSSVDLTLAAKVDDVGDTKLSGDSLGPLQLKQVHSAGLGLTLHTGADAIHLAADYRDIGDAYKQPLFKRLYAGTKVTVRQHFGVAAGFYQGYPSMGAEVDLFFLRLALTAYTRELGDHPGVAPRHMYMFSLSTGF